MTTPLAAKAQALRRRHHDAVPLVLTNAWDVASARLVARAGFSAVATSSGAVAATLGYPDDDSMPADEAFAAVSRISRSVDVPVTADMEAGYQLTPDEFVERLLAAGAVGCNLEDTDHHGPGDLVDAGAQAETLAAVKAAAQKAGIDIVVNARVDVFRTSDATPEAVAEAIHRARRYVDAGADCVYPILLEDEDAIAEFVAAVPAPVNILLRQDAPPLSRLAELGVARISLAGGLFRQVYAELEHSLQELSTEASRLARP